MKVNRAQKTIYDKTVNETGDELSRKSVSVLANASHVLSSSILIVIQLMSSAAQLSYQH